MIQGNFRGSERENDELEGVCVCLFEYNRDKQQENEAPYNGFLALRS